MTDKQIKDGVDISGCSYFYKHTHSCLVKMDAGGRYYKCANWHDCDFKKLSQQLKAKEQECEKAEEFANAKIKQCENLIKQLNEAYEQLEAYKMEAEEGKEINAELKVALKDISFENQKFCYQIEELTKQLNQLKTELKDMTVRKIDYLKESLKLKQTLAEIREIAERINITIMGGSDSPADEWEGLYHNTMKAILQKISEVENR